jgi:hypothetical protein
MKKKRLEIEYSYDFELLGISSSTKGYKLAWEINNALAIKLIKQPDLQIELKKNLISAFSYFSFQTEVNSIKLFRNKPNDSEERLFLIPEHPHFDYILMIQGEEYNNQSNRLQEVLRNIPSIEFIAFIPLAPLKSKDNFIF